MIGADVIAEVVLRVAKRIVTADDRRRDEVFRAMELATQQGYMDRTPEDTFTRARKILNFIEAEAEALGLRRKAIPRAPDLGPDTPGKSFEDGG